MKIDEDLVKHLAKLSRIHLSSEKLHLYQEQLERIVEYVAQVSELHESSEDLVTDFVDSPTPIREDICIKSDFTDSILKQAPDVQGTAFRVPQIIE